MRSESPRYSSDYESFRRIGTLVARLGRPRRKTLKIMRPQRCPLRLAKCKAPDTEVC